MTDIEKLDIDDQDKQPVHDYEWAKSKARDGFHLVCDLTLPGQRLVYAVHRFTLRQYDRNGITSVVCVPTPEMKQNATWRIYDD